MQIAARPELRRTPLGATAVSKVGRLVRCQVGGDQFALPLERVAEVVGLGSATATAPRGWVGTLVRNERPVPIGDLAFLLGLPPLSTSRHDARAVILRGGVDDVLFGVTVETVPTVSTSGDIPLQPLPLLARSTATGLVQGSIVLGDELLFILDADTIRERLAAGITRADDGRITELRSLPRRNGDPGRPFVEQTRPHPQLPAAELQVLLLTRMETADGGSGFAPAIPMAWVHEVRAYVAPRPLPHAPASLAGLMIWRERALPVIDLTQRLTGIPSTAQDGRRRLLIVGPQGAAPLGALIVPGVSSLQMVQTTGQGQQALPETLDPALFSAWTQHNMVTVAVLDPAACFA